MKYHIFFKNHFQVASAIGTATELDDGCLYMTFNAIPRDGVVMLVPEQPKAHVIPFKPRIVETLGQPSKRWGDRDIH